MIQSTQPFSISVFSAPDIPIGVIAPASVRQTVASARSMFS
jgi:hypothetical protein